MYCKFPSFRCPVPEQVETAMTEMRARRTMHGAAGCEGTPVVCNDGDPCTEDACAAGTGCVYTDGNGLPCDDGNACTTASLRQRGRSGATLACDDGEFCTSDSVTPQRAVCSPMRTGRAVTTEIVARPMMRAPEEGGGAPVD